MTSKPIDEMSREEVLHLVATQGLDAVNARLPRVEASFDVRHVMWLLPKILNRRDDGDPIARSLVAKFEASYLVNITELEIGWVMGAAVWNEAKAGDRIAREIFGIIHDAAVRVGVDWRYGTPWRFET